MRQLFLILWDSQDASPVSFAKRVASLRQSREIVLRIRVSEHRSIVVLRSRTLVYMDEHVVQEVNARQDDLTLIEFSDVLDRIVVKVAFYCTDLVIEHESVNEHRTYLTEEDRGYVLRVLCCEVKEDTLLTALSCKECKTAVIFLLGVSGLGISVNLINEEYERTDIVTRHNECTYEVYYHSADTF